MRPHSWSVRSTSPCSAALSEMLAACAIALPPRALIPAAISSQAPAFRLEITTFAPASAIRSAIARPIPRVEPVMRATRPVMSNNTFVTSISVRWLAEGESMDLAFSPEERAFRDEVREFIATHLPPDVRRKVQARDRLGTDRAPHLPRRDQLRLGATAAALRPAHGRAGDHRVRERRAARAVSADDSQRRRVLVPGLLRARRRLRPRLAADQRRA